MTEYTGDGGGDIFSDYEHAGGKVGHINANSPAIVVCRLTGWTDPNDGNNWWYHLSQSSYYVFADNFYNVPGQTSGSLIGTPHYDARVPLC